MIVYPPGISYAWTGYVTGGTPQEDFLVSKWFVMVVCENFFLLVLGHQILTEKKIPIDNHYESTIEPVRIGYSSGRVFGSLCDSRILF